MKLKTFFAANVPAAMEEIRSLLGEEAIIVSAHRIDNKGVKLIVATEEKNIDKVLNPRINDPKNQQRFSYFHNILKGQKLPDSFVERLVQCTMRKSNKTVDEKLLTAAFNELFNFRLIYPSQNNRLCVMVGNAGSGKTLCTAKLVFQAQKAKQKPAVVTLNPVKIGGHFELQTLTKIMKIPFIVVQDIKDLNETITMLRLSSNYIIVDTPALNPYISAHMEKLKNIRQQLSDAEIILTMPAGLEAQEAITQGSLFSKNGCSSLIATHLDCTRIYGGLLQTALYNQFQWTAISASSKIQEALFQASPALLTRLICMPELPENEENE